MEDLREKIILILMDNDVDDVGRGDYVSPTNKIISLIEKQAPVTVRLSAGLAVLRGEMRKREETARARKLHHAKEEAYLWAMTDKQEELHFQHFGKKLDELKEKYS